MMSKPSHTPKEPPAGRRFFADPKRQQELFKLLAIGASRADAAGKVGTTRRTIWNECDRDPAFKLAVEQAEAEGKVELIKRVFAAGKKDWRAAFAMLQAKYSEWSRNAQDATPNREIIRAYRKLGEQIRNTIPTEYLASLQGLLESHLESLVGCGDEGDDNNGD